MQRDYVVSGGYVYHEYRRKLPIPDRTPGLLATVVESILCSAEQGSITDIEVSVDVKHTYRSDLRIVLTAPYGTEVVLHDEQGGSADDITKTYTTGDLPELQNFIGKRAQGSWTLKISDLWPEDRGHLESWSLKLSF